MEHITTDNIDREIERIIDSCPMSRDNLKMLKLLHDVRCVLGGEHGHELTAEEAESWVRGMQPPARWTMEQTTSIMKNCGYSHKKCEFYAVMNMLWSDYGQTLARYGVDRPEVWAELAHDFLDDEDAVEGKTEEYYRHIAQNN